MKFNITLDIDTAYTVTKTELREYVEAALTCFSGSLRPPGGYSEDDRGDPMWGEHKVKVRKIRNSKELAIASTTATQP